MWITVTYVETCIFTAKIIVDKILIKMLIYPHN